MRMSRAPRGVGASYRTSYAGVCHDVFCHTYPCSLLTVRLVICRVMSESFGGNETGDETEIGIATRRAPFACQSRARGDPSANFLQRYLTVARVLRSRRVVSRPLRRASRPRRPPPISPIRAMMAFRSRKRKAGAARETQAEKPLVDAAASISTGSPTKHPVAAFANTVYVDPVIKVRRRARSRPRIARAIGSARLSRFSPRQTRIEITRHPKVGFALTPATHPTSPDFHTIRACIDTWIRRLS